MAAALGGRGARLGIPDRRVLAYVVDRALPDWQLRSCVETVGNIADELGMTAAALRRSAGRLLALGYLRLYAGEGWDRDSWVAMGPTAKGMRLDPLRAAGRARGGHR